MTTDGDRVGAPKENDPGKRITQVWLFVAVDEDGDEGLPAFQADNGMILPMVASDEKRRALLLQIARGNVSAGRIPGGRIEVRRFDGPAVIEDVIT